MSPYTPQYAATRPLPKSIMGFHMAFSASFYSPSQGAMDMSSWIYELRILGLELCAFWNLALQKNLTSSTRPEPLFKIHVLIVQIMKTMEPLLHAIVPGEVPSAYF